MTVRSPRCRRRPRDTREAHGAAAADDGAARRGHGLLHAEHRHASLRAPRARARRRAISVAQLGVQIAAHLVDRGAARVQHRAWRHRTRAPDDRAARGAGLGRSARDAADRVHLGARLAGRRRQRRHLGDSALLLPEHDRRGDHARRRRPRHRVESRPPKRRSAIGKRISSAAGSARCFTPASGSRALADGGGNRHRAAQAGVARRCRDSRGRRPSRANRHHRVLSAAALERQGCGRRARHRRRHDRVQGSEPDAQRCARGCIRPISSWRSGR